MLNFGVAAMTRRWTAAAVIWSTMFAALPALAVDWGPYDELVGTAWQAPSGFPRKAWRWSDDGSSILEIELRDAYDTARVTTLKPNKKGDALVAIAPGGGKSKARLGVDGSVLWIDEGGGQVATRVAIQNGALLEQRVVMEGGHPKKLKDEIRFARSADSKWADAAGGGKGSGKGKKKSGFADLIAEAQGKNKKKGGQSGGSMPAPQSSSSVPPQVPVPPVVAAPTAPVENHGESLDCMMAAPEVRARGCKPPSATTAPTPSPATGSAAGAVQTVSIDGRSVPVSRSFPPQILGRYLYEKKGEPIIELRGDGSGAFQAHMIAPIQIRWWLKAGANGAPEKITGHNGNYRYTVVLQYLNSTNGNYPSGSYASWYLDTDVAAGCSIILGERFKCR